jgi:NTP pyrophosphatase (non-canonical NTP hydrolase)
MNSMDRATQFVLEVTKTEPKTLLAMLSQLMQEVGELAEAVSVQEGYSTKTLQEPLAGEVADVVQCAISILARCTPDLTDEARSALLANEIFKKTKKWQAQQLGVQLPGTSTHIPRRRLADLVPALATHTVVKIPGQSPILNAVQGTPPRAKIAQGAYVNIRMHPKGLQQPIGKRRIYQLDEMSANEIFIRLHDGGGWKLDVTKPVPSFLDLLIDVNTRGHGTKVNALDFREYWRAHAV